MGTISAREVVDKASILLEDRVSKHWSLSELLGWLNDGQIQIVRLRPDAYSVVNPMQLAAGTRQTLPAADLVLIDIPRNMGSDGLTPGRAITFLDRAELDSRPDWHTETASSIVEHYCYDRKVPRVFWVYPQQPVSPNYVELLTSRRPPTLTLNGVDGQSTDSVLGLDDIWLNDLLQFVVYRAFSKDAEQTQNGGKAIMAWQEFTTMLGLGTESDQQFNPETAKPPSHDDFNRRREQGAFRA